MNGDLTPSGTTFMWTLTVSNVGPRVKFDHVFLAFISKKKKKIIISYSPLSPRPPYSPVSSLSLAILSPGPLMGLARAGRSSSSLTHPHRLQLGSAGAQSCSCGVAGGGRQGGADLKLTRRRRPGALRWRSSSSLTGASGGGGARQGGVAGSARSCRQGLGDGRARFSSHVAIRRSISIWHTCRRRHRSTSVSLARCCRCCSTLIPLARHCCRRSSSIPAPAGLYPALTLHFFAPWKLTKQMGTNWTGSSHISSKYS